MDMKTRTLFILRPMVLACDAPVTLDFVPPLQRRRLSRLQQRTFAVAHQITEGFPTDYRVVFASQDGEDELTRKLVAAFTIDGDVSPMRFSTSVYNAAPGLYSIFTKNSASYSALAAGDETLDCSLLEMLLAEQRTLWIYSEETHNTPTLGCFMLPEGDYDTAYCDGICCQWSAGVVDAPLLTPTVVAAFLNGETKTLCSRYFTLIRVSSAPFPNKVT